MVVNRAWNRKVNKCIENIQMFSGQCVFCGDKTTALMDLCRHCREDLPYQQTTCARCGISLPADGICGRCIQSPPDYDTNICVFNYAPPIDTLIHQLKFSHQLHHARLLGELMAEKIVQKLNGNDFPEVIIPVPLQPNRLRQRGYNQALEIARPIARRLKIPLDFLNSERIRQTPEQSRLPANKRRLNVKGAFKIKNLTGRRHVAIVDDVMTTGYTMAEMACELRKAGADKIQVWVCCRANL